MSHTRLFRLGAAAAVLAFAAVPSFAFTPRQASPAPGKSMLFRVRAPGGGATVYLLGSVHLLSPDVAKLPASVDSAFAKASVVAFETSLDSLEMRAPELQSRLRFTNGATLRSSLSPAGAAKADSILRSYGMSIDMVNQFKPWAVSIVLGQLVMRKANFQPDYGVDRQLNARAKAAHKKIIGLEPVDVQLNLFDNIPTEDQEKMLTEGESPDDAMKQLMRIKDTWLAGDAATLDSLLNSRMASSPRLFAALITERNKNWLPRIEQLARGSEDALVVVGAGHLVGKQGVLALLRSKGYTIEQM